MPLVSAARSQLLLVDYQERLMPAILNGPAAVENARKLAEAAQTLGISTLRTEQYPKGLGGTVAPLAGYGHAVEKMTFGSCATPAFLPEVTGEQVIVGGCEAHVCVLQTVFGLLSMEKAVFVVADAVGSRTEANHRAALERMARAGAEIVTTEMVIFEWLGSCEHPHFRALSKLIR